MRPILLWLGLAMIALFIGLSCWLGYLQLWVHPELTRPQMFWAYPWHFAAMVGAFLTGVTLLERTWKGKGRSNR